MIRLTLISLLVIMLLLGCNEVKTTKIESQKVVRNNIEMLYGKISLKQLYFDYPAWQKIEDEYNPDINIINQLQEIKNSCDVHIFLATWCGDSRREVPRFFKIIKEASIAERMKITMWAVDRKLTLDNGLAKKSKIERVATFIFYNKNIEIGRIVETPENLLEQDILNILKADE